MNPIPNTIEATERQPKLRRFPRFLELAGIVVVVFLLGLAFIQWWKPGLNDSERRFLGVWTWQDSPGEMTCHYHEDGTMHYTVGPNHTAPNLMTWKVDANVISVENVEQYSLKLIVKRVFQKHDQYPVTFNADGSIAFTISPGKVRVLIPWSSAQGELLKQSK